MEFNTSLAGLLVMSTPYNINASRTSPPIDHSNEKLVSNKAVQYIITINYAIILASFSFFGAAANCINIIVFVKMRFKETINIALLGLSISDLGSLVFALWGCILWNPLLLYSDIPVDFFQLHKPFAWSHIICMRISAFITVYITLERCLCIVFPLKIKQLVTHKRVRAIIIGIFVFIIACMSANYGTATLVWKFEPRRNESVLQFVFTAHRLVISTFSYYANAILVVISFVCVFAFSFVLIWKLNQRGKWLTEANSEQEKSSMARDTRVIKMVTYVAVIFILSNTPAIIFFLVMATIPEVNMGRRYQNMYVTLGSVMGICDAFNSSVNIFVYYAMSSKFAQTFCSLFSRTDKSEQKKYVK